MKANNEYTKAINWKLFYRNVFALVIPIAIQNLINDGCDHAWKSRREGVIRSISCRTDPIHHDTDLLRSDLRSNGSDGAVMGEERHQNDRESPGYGIKCRTHRCGSIRRSSPWHAGDTDADLYL